MTKGKIEVTKTKIEEGVIFELALIASGGPINSPAKINELGIDSLEFLDLLLAIEREFGIKIEAEQAAMCETVGDLIALVESKCA